MKKQIKKIILLGLAAGLFAIPLFTIFDNADAATITQTTLRETNMNATGASALRLIFKATQTSGTITINMNGADSTTFTGSGGTMATGAGTVSTAQCVTDGFNALPGTLTESSTAPNITISGATTQTVGTRYCVDITSNVITANATAGEYHPTITQGGDVATVALRTISNDQVVVSATVAPTFNFVLSGNTDSFATPLSSSAITDTTGVTATINTNAANGWYAWASDSKSGLQSTNASKTITSAATGSADTLSTNSDTPGYLLGITAITQGTGSGTTTAGVYDGTGGAGKGSGLDGTARVIASSGGTAGGAVLTIKERAGVATTTPAATDYTDTITLVAAGNF